MDKTYGQQLTFVIPKIMNLLPFQDRYWAIKDVLCTPCMQDG